MSTDVKKPETQTNPDLITATIDGIEIQVPKGTLVIRAAENIGIEIPRFCDHSLLDPVAACRQCIVEVPDAGNGRPMKPQPACALTVMPNMVVETGNSNAKVAKHQAGMLEFLLINHPLDCPICDKGGECPLQNQALSHGRGESRYEGVKRTYPKPVNISAQILIDRERCVLCQRCTRFGSQISGDDFISLTERGALSQITSYADHPYESYFSGNIIQICPVGALTSVDYRFQARPFDLVSTTTTCEHCAGGCQLRTDHRHFQVKRRLAGNDPEVNEEWNCDKGRFAFRYAKGPDRLRYPLVRRDGALVPASWPEAIDAAVEGLKKAGSAVGVMPGGRLTLENSYAYSRFARTVIGTNNIDYRSRAYGAEEASFLTSFIAGKSLDDSVTYTALENAKQVVLVCFEPEDEMSMVFLRLRKGWRKKGVKVVTLAPFTSAGSTKMGAEVIGCRPGDELAVLTSIQDRLDDQTIILVGERAGLIPGLLPGVVDRAQAAGARWAWMPRRSGEIAAINAGCLPTALPAARQVSDPQARTDMMAAWSASQSLPSEPGLDLKAMIAALADGTLTAAITGGISLDDLPGEAGHALSKAFVVSLEQRESSVTALADVVFPVALIEQQQGTFINWENRYRVVNQVNTNAASAMSDVRVLAALADAMGSDLGFRTPVQARADFDEICDWEGARAQFEPVENLNPAKPAGTVLASWHFAMDDARLMDHSGALKQTAPKPVARLSAATAARLGVVDGQTIEIGNGERAVRLPLSINASMVDDVVWAPTNTGVALLSELGVTPGGSVTVAGVEGTGGAK